MKKLAFSILVFGFCNVFSQNVCEFSGENQNELNVISSKKCLIPKDSDNETRNVSVNRPKRYLTVRNVKSYGIVQVHDKLENNKKALILALVEPKVSNENRVFSFLEVDNLPLFKGCKKATNKEEERVCYNTEIKKHIYDNLTTSEKINGNYNTGSINVKFNINKKGKVKDVEVLGSSSLKAIRTEVKNIVYKLPRFVSAKKEGENVSVSYDFKIDIMY